MRSRSRIAAWVVGLTVTAVVATLGCGGGGGTDSGIQLNGIAFGAGTFVAVGDSDRIFANPGTGWTPIITGTNTLQDVVWSRTLRRFVAVGAGLVVTADVDSSSGVPQLVNVQTQSPTASTLYSVAERDGQLIAVGDGGTILASTDGAVWTPRASGTTETLDAVAFSNDGQRVVAVGSGANVVISDDGGLTWQSTFVQFDDADITNLTGVAFGPNGWVVSGANGILLQSDDPTQWRLVGNGILPNLNAVVLVQGLYTVLGEKGRILTSPDGITYADIVSNTGQFLFDSAYGNGTYFVVGSGGRALMSFDGAIYQDTKI
ncbi:hypothetical protein K2Z84_33250 [Candidatus Binatia bacterium]|nr:hypothetical protein [Candidatus Binatia bacterium]